MIDLICGTLEKQALENNHNIGKGFYDAILAGKVPMLRMDCQDCDFFVVVDPTFGKHIQSKSGPCTGRKYGEQ